MKIGKQSSKRSPGAIVWFAVLAATFLASAALGGGWGPQLGGLRAVWRRLAWRLGEYEALPTLVVDMDFASYDSLLGRRSDALRDGVYIPSEDDFVRATIRAGDGPVPVLVRLMPGPADHLGEGQKWGYEVHTRQGQLVLGMQRFYLQDPADNNWLQGWAFARALERERVLVARYSFVSLVFNGDERGVYALQEGFGPELLAAQGRAAGPIVRFDVRLLWRSIAHFGGDVSAVYDDPVANLSAADWRTYPVDTFVEEGAAADPTLAVQREKALSLLRALQAGEAAAGDVFDVAQYGRYLALVDLWGASEGTWLANLRYYYDVADGRLEPIGFNANALGREDRPPSAATYGDPALQAAYAREMRRVSTAAYLDELRADLEPELLRMQQMVGPEQSALDPPWDLLAQRAANMRRSLDPVQPVFAYLGPPETPASIVLRLYVGNVLNLPVELVGFDVHGATVLPASREWLAEGLPEVLTTTGEGIVLRGFDRERSLTVRYVRFDIPLTEVHRRDRELDFMQPLDVQVITRIAGLEATQMTLAQEGYPEVRVGGGR